MINLDQTQQRILGVLLEKQRTVPDTYPMTEKSLITGCNQSSNRDPVMSLRSFEVAGALMSLHGSDIVLRIEGSSRAVKYRHKLDEILGIGESQLVVLAELLLRGPQAPGALKPRVARLGLDATGGEIEAVLHELANISPALVAQEPRRPRERDHRWRHLLGDRCEELLGSVESDSLDGPPSHQAVSSSAAKPVEEDAVMQRLADLERRVARLEQTLHEQVLDEQALEEQDPEPKLNRLADDLGDF